MIEIKLGDVINSMDIMQKLAGVSFNGKTAFKIARILKKLDDEIKTFNDTRTAIIKKYAEIDENGELVIDDNGNCKLKADTIADFNKELGELLDTTIEVNVDKLKVDDLDAGNFTPSEMIVLEPLIEE